MTYKTYKQYRDEYDRLSEQVPSEDTIPVWQAIVFGFLFLAIGWAYYFLTY